jgi:hypothetical protein
LRDWLLHAYIVFLSKTPLKQHWTNFMGRGWNSLFCACLHASSSC